MKPEIKCLVVDHGALLHFLPGKYGPFLMKIVKKHTIGFVLSCRFRMCAFFFSRWKDGDVSGGQLKKNELIFLRSERFLGRGAAIF